MKRPISRAQFEAFFKGAIRFAIAALWFAAVWVIAVFATGGAKGAMSVPAMLCSPLSVTQTRLALLAPLYWGGLAWAAGARKSVVKWVFVPMMVLHYIGLPFAYQMARTPEPTKLVSEPWRHPSGIETALGIGGSSFEVLSLLFLALPYWGPQFFMWIFAIRTLRGKRNPPYETTEAQVTEA